MNKVNSHAIWTRWSQPQEYANTVGECWCWEPEHCQDRSRRSHLRSTSESGRVDCLVNWGIIFSCEGCYWHFLFSQIVPILIGYVLVVLFILLLLLLVQSLLGFHGFQSFEWHCIGLSFPGGVMAWWYLHFLWVKPSRHLLLGVQQVRKVSKKHRKNCECCPVSQLIVR